MAKNEIVKFNEVVSVSPAGDLLMSGGRYSRSAIIMAFEMVGGVEAFAEWAEENKSDFYTKMFVKMVGREVETKSNDSIEEMLKLLEGEAVDVTDIEELEVKDPLEKEDIREPVKTMNNVNFALERAAVAYAQSEPEA